jgi:DNA polymerase-3 subunit delta
MCYNDVSKPVSRKCRKRGNLLRILIGEDDYSKNEVLGEIKKSIGDPASLLPNTTILEGAKVTPEQLRAACDTVPFLAEKRLVIAEGLLERFEPKSRPRKKKSSRQNDKPEDPHPIVESVKNLPPFTELVIIGGDIKASNPLLLALAPLAKVQKFPLLKYEELRRWIKQRAALQAKAGISDKAVDLMARLVGNDLWTMSNEIDKLALFTAGRPIEEADVRAAVSHAQDARVFDVVDAVMESRVNVAQELLQQLFNQGMEPVYILVMLARQVRIIFQIREMRDRGISRNAVRARLTQVKGYAFDKAWEQSDKFAPARLIEMYHKLLDADIAIKTGKYDSPELVLDILIAELGRRGAVVT